MNLHVHYHHFVAQKGANTYHECRCGHRYACWRGRVYSPVDEGWIRTGKWTPRPTRLPSPKPH
jgi:hypothetical protein